MKRIFITIYILLLIGIAVFPFGVGPIMEFLFQDMANQADTDLARGTFFLIAERLAGLDENEKRAVLEKLQPEFGYPLSLNTVDELGLPEKEKKAFSRGDIIWKDNQSKAFQRLPDSHLALVMGGPFPGDTVSLRVTLIFLFLFFLYLTLPALLWTFLINRDIRKIEKAADQFTAGDHAVRVKVSRVSSLTQIADAFNHMAEKSQKLLLSQKEIANAVSHEIRTPLSRIKFSLQILEDSIPEDCRENPYIPRIGRDVEEIEGLVDEMLTYARFEREPDSIESLPRNEIVFWLKTLILAEEKSFPDKIIQFRTLPETDRFITRFEPIYLGWAVRNLIRNACKYADKNITVTFEPNPEICAIHVDDDGRGIPADNRDRIFEPFFRIDGSRNRNSGGYGLGLAIAKRIAAWHRGSLSVDRSPAQGARFTLYLPMTG